MREEEPEPVKPKREEDTGYHVIQEAEMASPIPRRAGRFDRDEGGRHGMHNSSGINAGLRTLQATQAVFEFISNFFQCSVGIDSE